MTSMRRMSAKYLKNQSRIVKVNKEEGKKMKLLLRQIKIKVVMKWKQMKNQRPFF